MTHDSEPADAAVAGVTRHIEVEVKFDIDPGQPLPDFCGAPLVRPAGITAADTAPPTSLVATYFDTERLDLLRSKVTLRRRTGGKDEGWHVKLPAKAGARTELGLPLGADAEVPEPFRVLLRGTARGRALTPVATLETTRTVTTLADPSGVGLVEIADDTVAAVPLLPGGPPPSNWREVEAELLNGNMDQLAAVSAALRDAGARGAAGPSKVARALGFDPAARSFQSAADGPATSAGGPATSAGGPAAGQQAAVLAATGGESQTAGAVIAAALAGHRDSLIVADRALREHTDTALHDARATARRIRSLLRVYRPLLETDAGLVDRLREFGAALSPARDLEVLQDRLFTAMDDEPEGLTGEARADLARTIGSQSSAARRQADAAVGSEDYLELLRDLDQFVADPPFAPRAARPAATGLHRLLMRAARRLGRKVDHALADVSNDEALHEARKTAKTARYAAEAATTALGDAAASFAEAAEQIQETLGAHHDAAVAGALLLDLATAPQTSGAAGFTFGRLHAFEQAEAAAALQDFTEAWADLTGKSPLGRLGGTSPADRTASDSATSQQDGRGSC